MYDLHSVLYVHDWKFTGSNLQMVAPYAQELLKHVRAFQSSSELTLHPNFSIVEIKCPKMSCSFPSSKKYDNFLKFQREDNGIVCNVYTVSLGKQRMNGHFHSLTNPQTVSWIKSPQIDLALRFEALLYLLFSCVFHWWDTHNTVTNYNLWFLLYRPVCKI